MALSRTHTQPHPSTKNYIFRKNDFHLPISLWCALLFSRCHCHQRWCWLHVVVVVTAIFQFFMLAFAFASPPSALHTPPCLIVQIIHSFSFTFFIRVEVFRRTSFPVIVFSIRFADCFLLLLLLLLYFYFKTRCIVAYFCFTLAMFFFLLLRWLSMEWESVAAVTASSGDNGGHKRKWNNGFRISTQNKVQTTTIAGKKQCSRNKSRATKKEDVLVKRAASSCVGKKTGTKSLTIHSISTRSHSLKNVLMHSVLPRLEFIRPEKSLAQETYTGCTIYQLEFSSRSFFSLSMLLLLLLLAFICLFTLLPFPYHYDFSLLIFANDNYTKRAVTISFAFTFASTLKLTYASYQRSFSSVTIRQKIFRMIRIVLHTRRRKLQR